ncbi:MAG TPA: glycosyltransferase family 2 protein, partial [Burkholderiales bacterium]|nr:glycosyltransferase family 2 protein [Burkholderiales bacterium]
TAIIVTYQSARTIGRALAAARRCHDAGLLDLVVVDNASSDATREILAREAGWARVVLEATNHGFGRGCNLGVEHVRSPYTILINPDAVVEPEALRSMLEFMEQRPNAGIVGPATLCGNNDELQPTGPYPTPWSTLRDALPSLGRSSAVPIVPGSAPMRTGWVCGAILMIRSALMRELGGFDPRFFLYWEEIDLCLRAERAGFENWVLGSALARHVVGASSSGGPRVGASVARHYFQSRYYYMAKHHGWLVATAAELAEFALLGMKSLLDALRGRGLQRLQPRLQAPLLSLPDER